MKKVIILLSIGLFLAYNFTFAQRSQRSTPTETQEQKQEQVQEQTHTRSGNEPQQIPFADPKTKFDFRGYVVSLSKVMLGQDGRVTKEEAERLIKNGQPLALMVNKKVMLVFNADGSYASNLLARLAPFNTIGVKGKRLTRAGITFIQAADMQPIN